MTSVSFQSGASHGAILSTSACFAIASVERHHFRCISSSSHSAARSVGLDRPPAGRPAGQNNLSYQLP